MTKPITPASLVRKILFIPAFALNLAAYSLGYLLGAIWDGVDAGWKETND